MLARLWARMLSPTRATSAAAAPAKPDRARLVAQLKNLEALIAKLDLDEQEQGPDKGKGKGKEDIKLNKRMRKMLARKEQENGPLPPSLANAPKRHVALLFSYEGWAYSGLAYQPKGVYTPLPTVEGTLLAALEKARLIEPIDEGEGFGCGFERCGRTDAGVSSSAQVVNLWVRSDLDDPMLLRGRELDPDSVEGRRHARSRSPSRERARSDSEASTSSSPQRPPKARTDVEIPYVTLLNKHLPPSIRIHAWSPVSATFSSRYSCIWRHYKYFFSTSPAHALLATRFDFGAAYKAAGLYPEHASPDWKDRLARVNWHGLELDVELMKDAVRRLVGEHDFRNFCKVDPPKQLPIHVRTVISATIDPLEGEGDDMFVLNLRGGAFVSRRSVSLPGCRAGCFEAPPAGPCLQQDDRNSHKS
jgi:tRNA pseudouridine38/39 synthase